MREKINQFFAQSHRAIATAWLCFVVGSIGDAIGLNTMAIVSCSVVVLYLARNELDVLSDYENQTFHWIVCIITVAVLVVLSTLFSLLWRWL